MLVFVHVRQPCYHQLQPQGPVERLLTSITPNGPHCIYIYDVFAQCRIGRQISLGILNLPPILGCRVSGFRDLGFEFKF